MGITKKIIAFICICICLSIFATAAIRTSYVDNYYSQHSLYNISNITITDNYFGPGPAGSFNSDNFTDLLAINISNGNLLTPSNTSWWTTLWNAVSGALWNSANETKFTNENFTDQLALNMSDIRETTWDWTNNDSLVLDNDTLCRIGKGCNMTDLNVSGILNITEGYKGASELATLDDLISGNVTITTIINIRNDEPNTLSSGTPVYFSSYISGINTMGVKYANNTNTLAHTDCLILGTIVSGSQGSCVETGHVTGVDTSDWSVSDTLYTDTGGNLTTDYPFTANCIQTIGHVLREHGSLGVIWVHGAGRCNDAPKDINITGNITAHTIFADLTGSATIENATVVSLPLGWTNLTTYPTACPSNTWVSTLDDSSTCTGNPDIYAMIDGSNVTGNWNHTEGNYSFAENGTSCYGWNCEGQVYFNGSSLVIKMS